MRGDPAPRRRPAPRPFLPLVAGLFLLAGCTPSSHATASPGTAIVVFVDFSESVRGPARKLYEADLDGQILPSMSAGDRLLVAAINDKTLTEFRPLIDTTLPRQPAFNGWFDNVLKYNRDTKDHDAQEIQLKATLKARVAEVLAARESAKLTDIFSSLRIAGKLFHDEPRRKVLVLMSDMIEDYPPYHFEDIAWDPATTRRLVGELDAKGLIPRLTNVCVYVSGVSGRSADVVENIGRFWKVYFERAQADMDESRYAHVLLHWPPSPSCGVPKGRSDAGRLNPGSPNPPRSWRSRPPSSRWAWSPR